MIKFYSSFRRLQYFVVAGISCLIFGLYTFEISRNEHWDSYPYPLTNLLYLIFPFLVILISKTIGFFIEKPIPIFITVIGAITISFIATSQVPGLYLALAVNVMIFFITAGLGQILTSTLFNLHNLKVSYNYVIGTILFHHILFTLATFNSLNSISVISVIVLSTLLILYFNFKKNNHYLKSLIQTLNFSTFSILDKFLYATLWMILLIAFITICAPHTYADGVVERLPYLNQILANNGFPYHYQKWGLMIPLPLNFTLAGTHIFCGELGSSINIFFYSVCFVFIVYNLMKHFEIARTINLFSLTIISSISPIWLLLTIFYFDIWVSLIVLAGLLMFLEARQSENSKLHYLSFLLWGFAFSAKINSAIAIVAFLITWFLIERSYIKYFIKHLWPCAFSFLFASGPWLVKVYLETGNPFFPFFSFLNNSNYKNAQILNQTALSDFRFDGSLIQFIKIPWDFTFSIQNFGEYLPFVNSPVTSIIFFVVMINVFFNYDDFKATISKKDFVLLIVGLLTIFSTSYFLKAKLFRYWITGFILVFIFLARGISIPYMSKDNQHVLKKRFYKIFIFTITCAAAAQLLLVGTRLNYFLPNGLGDTFWFDKVAREKFLKQAPQGVSNFLNSHLKENEAVLLTNYFYANYIHNPSIFAADQNALFGIFKNLDQFKNYIEKYRVKFWVVNIDNTYEFAPSITESYWKEDFISFASANYIVYNLQKTKSHKRIYFNQSELGKINFIWKNSSGTTPLIESSKIISTTKSPLIGCFINNYTEAIYTKINFSLTSSVANSNLIWQVIQLDDVGTEISRQGGSKNLSIGLNTATLYSHILHSTSQICLQINPWMEKDGEYNLNSLHIEFNF